MLCERLCCLYWLDRRLHSSVNKIEMSLLGGRWTNLSSSPWLSVCLAHSRMQIFSCKHLLYNAEVPTLYSVTSFFYMCVAFAPFFPQQEAFWFMNSSGLSGFKHNYASNRVLFDPCQSSLKPYVFSWHLYHIVGLIQTLLSVCACNFVSSHGGIFAWLLVAALPVCLYSSADLMTQKVTMRTRASRGS